MNLAALSIGLIVGFYWGRVIKLVYKTRRLTGKAANFLPPEPLGRFLRIIWYPTVGLWIAHPLSLGIYPNQPSFLRPVFYQPMIAAAAVLVALAALAATMVCWRKMGKSWRMGIDPGEKTQLIVSGPYAYVRNPIYALSSILMLASAIAVPSSLMFILAAIHLLFLQWEARREEKYLLTTHGDEFGRYMRTVGRFIPKSLSPFQTQR